ARAGRAASIDKYAIHALARYKEPIMAAVFQIKQPTSYNNTRQRLAYTSANGASTAAFGSETQQVRLVATSPCFYLVFSTTDTSSQAASTSGDFLPANWVDHVTVRPGQKVSV